MARLEQFLVSELRPDAVKATEALSVETHGSLQKSEIVTLSLLFLGLAIALGTSMAVGRAVLAGEAVLRDSEERLTSLNATLEQKVDERTRSCASSTKISISGSSKEPERWGNRKRSCVLLSSN